MMLSGMVARLCDRHSRQLAAKLRALRADNAGMRLRLQELRRELYESEADRLRLQHALEECESEYEIGAIGGDEEQHP